MKLAIMFALGAVVLVSQPNPQISQQAGNCSVNIAGDNNTTASLVCNNVDPKLANQIREILNGTRRTEKETKEISEKLDEIKQLLGASNPSLTEDQKKTFSAILKGAPGIPTSTFLTCPELKEDACIYAASFIALFLRAGWQIEPVAADNVPSVERVRLAIPTNSIVIARPGPIPLHPQNPDEGIYTKVQSWQQPLIDAFEAIGIHPIIWNDAHLPDDKARIYFGSVTGEP